MPATASAITREAITAVRSARRIIRLIQTPLMPSTSSIPSTKRPATSSASATPPKRVAASANSAACEMVSKDSANSAPIATTAHERCTVRKRPEHPGLEAGWRHDGIRPGDQHGAQVEESEPEQEDDRHRGARDLEPRRRLPAGGQRAGAQAPRAARPRRAPAKTDCRPRARDADARARCSASGRRSSRGDRRRTRAASPTQTRAGKARSRWREGCPWHPRRPPGRPYEQCAMTSYHGTRPGKTNCLTWIRNAVSGAGGRDGGGSAACPTWHACLRSPR